MYNIIIYIQGDLLGMKKIREISLYEVFLCLFVILIHVLSGGIDGYIKGSYLSIAAFTFSRNVSFAVPAFIMASAIKLSGKFTNGKIHYFRFLKGRLAKVYLPFLLWVFIYYLYFVYHRNYFPFTIKDALYYLATGRIAAPFYFVIVIMQFYLLMPLWVKMFTTIGPRTGITASILITLVSKYFTYGMASSNRIFLNYLMFWIIGCYIGSNYSKYITVLEKYKRSITVCSIIFTATYIVFAYMEFLDWFYLFSTEVLKYVFCIASALSLLLICRRITLSADTNKLCKVITAVSDTLSPTTFYVYLIHCLFIFETEFAYSS